MRARFRQIANLFYSIRSRTTAISGSTPVIPSLDFSINTNSQYIPLIF